MYFSPVFLISLFNIRAREQRLLYTTNSATEILRIFYKVLVIDHQGSIQHRHLTDS